VCDRSVLSMTSVGAPPTYMSSVGNPGINPGIPGPQPQPLASQMSPQPGYYGGAAAAAVPSSDVGGSIPPVKI